MGGGRLWWEREDLGYRDGRLAFGGQDLAAIAEAGTPAYVYRPARVLENLARLRAALDGAGVVHDAYFAIKANRHGAVLEALRADGACGIDACSPDEVAEALAHGFREDEVSFTGHAVSEPDLDRLAAWPAVHVNCDAISTIRRLGRRCPGRRIGIRLNPGLGAGYNERLRYAGEKATKFGVYPDRFAEAMAMAKAAGMAVDTLHLHVGCGYQGEALEAFDRALAVAAGILEAYPGIRRFNVGGGLGLRMAEAESAIDLGRWAAVVARHVRPRGLRVAIEPGDYLVKDAGLLLVRVNTVEDKGGTRFAGVDAGLGILNLPAYYGIPVVVAPLAPRAGVRRRVTVSGNINEALDLLAEDVELPPVEEGDLLALLNVGGYGAAAASNHCMRGSFREVTA